MDVISSIVAEYAKALASETDKAILLSAETWPNVYYRWFEPRWTRTVHDFWQCGGIVSFMLKEDADRLSKFANDTMCRDMVHLRCVECGNRELADVGAWPVPCTGGVYAYDDPWLSDETEVCNGMMYPEFVIPRLSQRRLL